MGDFCFCQNIVFLQNILFFHKFDFWVLFKTMTTTMAFCLNIHCNKDDSYKMILEIQ